MQPPAKSADSLTEIESSIEDAMQKWLDNALESNDSRNRIAVANGVSRGMFGSLHLGAGDNIEPDAGYIDDEEFKHAA